MEERRQFSRVLYQAPANIRQGKELVQADIRDLSLHGLLLNLDSTPTPLRQNQLANVEFALPDSDIIITLVANLVGIHDNILRASIDHIDIESIGHLRRLIELNVGSDELLHRELEHLSDLGEHV